MPAQRKRQPLIELGITIVIPAVILMKFSDAQALGPVAALLLALSFPLAWGVVEWLRHGKPAGWHCSDW